ncbi:MAG: Hydrogenase 1 maturation protease [Anaerolineales bacterium]|nr:Hydrogenase 1 maturation protease [Anaerolineales bacterium]
MEGGEGEALPSTLVIGLGNLLRGDDGVGVRVAEALATRDLPDDVEVVDGGTHGLGLVNFMEGRQRVILVDAADVGESPGEFRRFTLDEARLLGDDRHLSVHAAGLRDALLLAQALDVLPDEVVIFGVQPANLEWYSALSPQVKAALPDLITAVMTELNQKLGRREVWPKS